MNNTTHSPQQAFRLGILSWVIIAGLLFLGIAFFAESFFEPRILLWWLFRLDFRYWTPDVAYPLWLIVALLVAHALTFLLPRADVPEARQWTLQFESALFSVKVCLALIIAYSFVNISVPIRGHWFWWYPANLLLFALFLVGWSLIYKTKNQTKFTQEMLNVRKRFLIMSCTIVAELGIIHFLYLTGLIRFLSTPLWHWLGYGYYTHWGVLALCLICAAVGIMLIVIKEWLAAILRVRKANRQKLSNTGQQEE